MKHRFLFKGCRLISGKETLTDPYIETEDGQITFAGSREARHSSEGMEVFECPEGSMLVPGFIDVHIHGTHRADVMDAEDWTLPVMAEKLPEEGTTAFLATTLTQSTEAKMQALQNAAAFYKKQNQSAGAALLGVHLEGPFISEKRAGAQPRAHIADPDPELFDKFMEASDHLIKLVTLAPEKAPSFVAHVKSRGAVPSIGHSDATYSEAAEAIEYGLCHATHLFNGMRGIHHRDPGVAGAVFLHDELKAELITDGIHVSPEIVRLTYLNKGADGIVIITDAMRAKGLPAGSYDLGGQEVSVNSDRAELEDGTLAGSVLKMNDAVKNMITFTGCSVEEAVQMATMNPARQLGIEDRKGSIAPGKDADLVVLDRDFTVLHTFCTGELVFSR
ncbi:N-acetylglucosamine-6-phosphate deacetylase [Alteribacter natronophilus]|uniref:N-acetylglucosamine-6-phosphate deacetylase n=1 Tax=Alteribacter natronophilus TaxID=2583810 RepID=UPI00110E1D5F|nr:N-acetylglucosamine-6-phosphate deacetylase [Alteribacter natronophilus]TMW70942.1 N-acetylglucosamine-6-phosphate deacetylase [Alteribacter natronophilus]